MEYIIAIKFDKREVGEEISLPIGIAKPLLDKGVIAKIEDYNSEVVDSINDTVDEVDEEVVDNVSESIDEVDEEVIVEESVVKKQNKPKKNKTR